MKIGYLGPAGTYTEKALREYAPEVDSQIYPNIDAVFSALKEGEISQGFVPLENSINGFVEQTYDNLSANKGKIKIIDAHLIHIRHCLGALPGHGDITRLLSKDTALEQCSTFLNDQYPNAEFSNTSSTARAMQIIAEESQMHSAAVGSYDTFAQYGLEVIHEDIGNKANNKTRFAVIGYDTLPTAGKSTTTIGLYPQRDRVGILDEGLSIIKSHGINMSSIQSRPDGRGRFYFFLDLEGHISEDIISTTLDDLAQTLPDTRVHHLGSYSAKPFIEQKISTIGYIGGKGKMSQFFIPFWESKGYTVLVSDIATDLNKADCVAKSDAVFISVPPEHTVGVIEEVGPLMEEGQLLFDNNGNKLESIKKMVETTGEGVEVLGLHTMFGPKTQSLLGQNVISIFTEKSGDRAEEMESLFYKHGAEITRTSAEEHDRAVTFSQNLEHVTAAAHLATIGSLSNLGKLQPFATPNFRDSLSRLQRIHGADPKLLTTMIALNPHALETLQTYADTINNLVESIAKNDFSTLQSMLEENKHYLE